MKNKIVKIDEILKKEKTEIKKRGRPKKEKTELKIETKSINDFAPIKTPDPVSVQPLDSSAIQSPQLPIIQPQYDTTEEVKVALQTPFELWALFKGNKKYALGKDEIEAALPCTKMVYDKHIKPALGEHSDLAAFAVVMAGLIAKRMSIVDESAEFTAPVSAPPVFESHPEFNQ